MLNKRKFKDVVVNHMNNAQQCVDVLERHSGYLYIFELLGAAVQLDNDFVVQTIFHRIVLENGGNNANAKIINLAHRLLDQKYSNKKMYQVILEFCNLHQLYYAQILSFIKQGHYDLLLRIFKQVDLQEKKEWLDALLGNADPKFLKENPQLIDWEWIYVKQIIYESIRFGRVNVIDNLLSLDLDLLPYINVYGQTVSTIVYVKVCCKEKSILCKEWFNGRRITPENQEQLYNCTGNALNDETSKSMQNRVVNILHAIIQSCNLPFDILKTIMGFDQPVYSKLFEKVYKSRMEIIASRPVLLLR